MTDDEGPAAREHDAAQERSVRVFLSYAWESDDYRDLVERLAVRLRRNGVDARLDRWHLAGRTIPEFMNAEVRLADKVLILGSPAYREKVHATEEGVRVAGVGWEAMLIGSQLFAAADFGQKLVVVIARGSPDQALPSFLVSRDRETLLLEQPFDEVAYQRILDKLTGVEARAPRLGPLPKKQPPRVRPPLGRDDSVASPSADVRADRAWHWLRFAFLMLFVLLQSGSGESHPRHARPGTKNVVEIAIILNGDVHYTNASLSGFRSRIDELLAPTAYSPHFEQVTGSPELSSDAANEKALTELLSRFPRPPDYLVTIGTRVSELAAQRYLNRIPIVFIGVSDPQRSNLVAPQANGRRGNIAGVRYGLPVATFMEFIAKIFPGRSFGYVYSAQFPQDVYVKDQLLELAPRLSPALTIVPIEVQAPPLTPAQESLADVFFGRHFVSTRLAKFTANTTRPWAGSAIHNVHNGAVAAVGVKDEQMQAGRRDDCRKELVAQCGACRHRRASGQ